MTLREQAHAALLTREVESVTRRAEAFIAGIISAGQSVSLDVQWGGVDDAEYLSRDGVGHGAQKECSPVIFKGRLFAHISFRVSFATLLFGKFVLVCPIYPRSNTLSTIRRWLVSTHRNIHEHLRGPSLKCSHVHFYFFVD